ncbi:MAG TPA: amidase family protein [Acidimicrobiia bacterium]|jgi:amidase
MKRISPPTGADLDHLASRWGFTIPDDQRADCLSILGIVYTVLDGLGELGEISDVAEPGGTAPGGRASTPADRDSDPLNAVRRWCQVLGRSTGPLAGRRVGVKDSISVAGIPMSCGSRFLGELTPAEDSTVVKRILGAGGSIVATLNMDDLAFSGGGESSAYGPVRNPFSHDRSAGGSSGGSAAALYYEGVDVTLGCDQGGSIRVPAAWCGVLGLKPTHGLVPYTGIAGIDQTFDHVGPLGLRAEDLALLLQVVAGADPEDPRQRQGDVRADYVAAVENAPDSLSETRIGLVLEGFDPSSGTTEEVARSVSGAIDRMQDLGATVEEVSVPAHLKAGSISFWGFVEGMTALMLGGGNGYHWPGRYWPELATAMSEAFEARADALPMQVKAALMLGSHVAPLRGEMYGRAQNLRPWLRRDYDAALERCDVLLMPTTPDMPFQLGDNSSLADRVLRGWTVLTHTAPTDMTGHPALSLPATSSDGLPVGVMLIGRHFDEERLLSVARTYERAVGWEPVARHR